MNWFETLSAAVIGGSVLGATLAGFFAYRRGAREKVLSALVGDYEKRVAQLEGDNADLQKHVQQLENERQLPLTQLTELIVSQHTQQMTSLNNLTTELANTAKAMSDAVGLTGRRKR